MPSGSPASPPSDEGQQARQVEAAPHRDRRDDLAGQAAEHRQGRRQLRLQRPGPERHGREAKAESREALHEAGQGGAESDDQDQFHVLSSRPAGLRVKPAMTGSRCRSAGSIGPQ